MKNKIEVNWKNAQKYKITLLTFLYIYGIIIKGG